MDFKKKVIVAVGAALAFLLLSQQLVTAPPSVEVGRALNQSTTLPTREPDETFAFESGFGAPDTPVSMKVMFWRTKAGEACLAKITAPANNRQLDALAKGVARGFPDGRLGLGATLLGKCSGRFVVLDGSTGVPGQWGEWIGTGVPGVEHSVSIVAMVTDSLSLRVIPGTAPSRTAEASRLQSLINDIDKAGASGVADAVMLKKRARFQSALDSLLRS